MLRNLVGILLLTGVVRSLDAQGLSVFYIASPNGTLSWCHCPDDPYGGLPRRASAINEVRKKNPSLLILDAGDILAPFPSRLKDSVFVEAYAKIPLDAVALGDQELVDGYEFFSSRIKDRLPLVSLNVFRQGRRLVSPYIIKEIDGHKIVITSLINKNAFLFYDSKLLSGVMASDPLSELKSMMQELKEKGDFIILLSHLGIDEERKIALQFPEISVIVSGHTPANLPNPEKVGNAYILGAGADAKYFGVAQFKIDSNTLPLEENEVIPLSDKYPEDQAIQKMIAPYLGDEGVAIDSSLVPDTASKVSGKHIPVLIDLFFAPDCPHCMRILKVFLPQLAKRHPGLFTVKLHDINESKEYTLLEQMEAEANDRDNEIPVLFFEGKVAAGEDDVKQNLESQLLSLRPDYSKSDSASYSKHSFSINVDTINIPTDSTFSTTGSRELVFFSTYGCKECDRARSLLRAIASEDSSLSIKVYSIEDTASKTLLAAFNEAYSIPKDKRLLTPVIFVGKGYLMGDGISQTKIKALVKSERENKIPWETIDSLRGKGKEQIIKQFKEFRILPIIGAGLIDGINPCAFATLIFFITYLSVLGVDRRKVIWVAIPFIVSVFLTYFILGLIAYELLAILTVLRWVSRAIFAFTVVFLIVLAFFSFRDYWLLKRGQGDKMTLKMPDRIRKRMNKMIRERTTLGGFLIGAVVTGFFVSLFELVCTGQVYLPTLVYVAQISEFRAKAFLYLVLYNIAFIIPLVIVFILVRFGLTEKHLQVFLTRRAGLTKILTAVLFIVLAGVMAFLLIQSLSSG